MMRTIVIIVSAIAIAASSALATDALISGDNTPLIATALGMAGLAIFTAVRHG